MWMGVMRWLILDSNISGWKILECSLYAYIQMSCFLFQKNKLRYKTKCPTKKDSKMEKKSNTLKIYISFTISCFRFQFYNLMRWDHGFSIKGYKIQFPGNCKWINEKNIKCTQHLHLFGDADERDEMVPIHLYHQ